MLIISHDSSQDILQQEHCHQFSVPNFFQVFCLLPYRLRDRVPSICVRLTKLQKYLCMSILVYIKVQNLFKLILLIT